MNNRFYIRGVENKSQEVLNTLKEMGGYNFYNIKLEYFGNPDFIFYLNPNGYIINDNGFMKEIITTHQDWEELFIKPNYKFKHSDIVLYEGVECKIIEQMNVKGKPYYKILCENDSDDMSLKLVSEKDLEYKYPILTWDDFEKYIENVFGYYVDEYGNCVENNDYPDMSKNTYHSQKHAMSGLAGSKISHLIEQSPYGGWCEKGKDAYVIVNNENDLFIYHSKNGGGFLRFHNREQAKLFLKHNEQLVKDYLLI